jgi:hypothetical protein
MSKNQEKDETLELIKLVDYEYKNSFFNTVLNIELGAVYVLMFGLLLFFEVYFLSALIQIQAIFTSLVSLLALLIAFRAFVNSSNERLQVKRNYYFILSNYSEKTWLGKRKIWLSLLRPIKIDKEDPLLKAIIKIKAKNPQLNIWELYKSNKLLFSKKKLIESLLYE